MKVCAFCAKPSTEVKTMIKGPVCFICNECIELCVIICAEAYHGKISPNPEIPSSKVEANA